MTEQIEIIVNNFNKKLYYICDILQRYKHTYHRYPNIPLIRGIRDIDISQDNICEIDFIDISNSFKIISTLSVHAPNDVIFTIARDLYYFSDIDIFCSISLELYDTTELLKHIRICETS